MELSEVEDKSGDVLHFPVWLWSTESRANPGSRPVRRRAQTAALTKVDPPGQARGEVQAQLSSAKPSSAKLS